METGLEIHSTSESGGIGGNFKNLDRWDADLISKRASPKLEESQVLPTASPSVESSNEFRQSSADQSSDIAPEIVVWTEEMDLDQLSHDGSEDGSIMDINDQ